MSRFYVKPANREGDKILVDGEEAHHILDVMRLKEGDEVAAFDGTGKEYLGTIEGVSRRSLTIKIDREEEHKRESGCMITLAQAVPKREKMDYIVEKVTELGAYSIMPIYTKRTIVKLTKERLTGRMKRWNSIALEASKQCGRHTPTVIDDYLEFNEALKKSELYDLVIMPSVSNVEKMSIKEALADFRGESILVFIGPEGGFDPSEIKAASEECVRFISLGENVLKCDTAAIAAVTMINYALGEE